MSARRVSLSDLAERQEPIHELGAGVAPTETRSVPTQVIDEGSAPPEERLILASAVRSPTSLRTNSSKKTKPSTLAMADPPHRRYDEYDRKETRLRDDQYGRLTSASRRLNKARKGQGDRITENTLIRVAIDLLLAAEDELAGTTESELRKSVGL